jgi:hypothetical protein
MQEGTAGAVYLTDYGFAESQTQRQSSEDHQVHVDRASPASTKTDNFHAVVHGAIQRL